MARINLLPWRKEQRERKNKEFNLLAGATAGVAVLVTVLALSLLGRDLSNQQDANKRIEDANAQLDVALKSIEDLEAQRDQMIAQMKVVQDLQGKRSIPVRVWDDLARAMPEAMYLNSIKREADSITLTGFAANPNVVASLVRNLNASEWLDGSVVSSIKSRLEAYQDAFPKLANADKARPIYPEDSYVEFVVTTKVQNPRTEEEKAKSQENGDTDVILPPVMDAAEMPEVAPIGIENAPVPAENPAPTNAGEPAGANNQPVASAEPVAPQSEQPVVDNSNAQAGGQQ